MTEAAEKLLAFGFDTLNLDEIVSFAVHNNTRSFAVMERIGLKRDATRDFSHPRVPETHPHLKLHLFYALSRQDYLERSQ